MTETYNKKLNTNEEKQNSNYNFPKLHLEVNGVFRGLSVTVSEVVGISKFSDDEAVVLLKKGSVILKGKMLEITVFEDYSVEIRGRISEIHFNNPKSRG